MFKLDFLACLDAVIRCEKDGDPSGLGEPADAVLREVSRQIREAGGPDGTLEEQLRTLLDLYQSAKDPVRRASESACSDPRSIGIPDPPPPPPPPSAAITRDRVARAIRRRDFDAPFEQSLVDAVMVMARGEPACSLCLDSGWVAGTAQVERPTRCLYGCGEAS